MQQSWHWMRLCRASTLNQSDRDLKQLRGHIGTLREPIGPVNACAKKSRLPTKAAMLPDSALPLNTAWIDEKAIISWVQ